MPLLRFAVFYLCFGLVASSAGVVGRVLAESKVLPETEAPATEKGTPAFYLEKAGSTPSFYQRDPRGEFPNGGKEYCCPTAISNSLICLARRGCKGLVDLSDPIESQIELINTLAAADYCGTDPNTGTPPKGILRGVRRYVQEQGFKCTRLEYKGWRSIGDAQQSALKAKKPDLAWLKSGISNPGGAVWLNIGWYVAAGDDGEWKRIGGHWVSLVGYGRTDGDSLDSNLLIIRNPNRKSSKSADSKDPDFSDDSVHLTLLSEGDDVTVSTKPRSLEGFYRVNGSALPVKQGTWGILDCAVLLVVNKP